MIIYRPWGNFKVIHTDKGYTVKILTIDPGQAISLQSHQLRQETWVIVEGTGELVLGKELTKLSVTQISSLEKYFIDKQMIHRVRNTGNVPLVILELQTGICSEEDIQRFKDDYGRVDG
jgi:mannose-6-phosphate isomerase-like protein (cupin superfamily)